MKILKKLKNFNKAKLPLFKISLFREGLRQLRTIGIAYTVIAALVTLRFSISGLRDGTYMHNYTLYEKLSNYLDDLPMSLFLLASFFAVLAVFYITGFMRSAKARDFYCAAPHSHGTLWLNFSAAALVWTAAGIGAFLLVTGAVFMPSDPKVFWALCFIACNIFSAVFMVFGMATLAVTLTGRLVPALATLAGFSALSTCFKIAYTEGWDAIFTKFNLVTKTSDLELYDPIYYILKRMFLPYSYDNHFPTGNYQLFSSWSTIAYGLLFCAVMLAVAAVFGTIRTGDAVGKPFVNEAAHIISLTAVTLPIGTGISYFSFRICEYAIYGYRYSLLSLIDWEGLFSCLLLALLIAGSFWAIELLLTFDVRHSHRAFKYFPLPVVVAMAALLVGFFGMQAAFNTVPLADEVESFTLVRNAVLPDELAYFRMNETFGRAVTDEAEFTDQETIRYVTGVMKKLSDKNGHDLRKATNAPVIWENEETGSFDYNYDGKGNPFITLRLNLKNGKHLTRTVAFDMEHIKGLEEAMLSDGKFMKKFLTLPSADRINLDIQEHDGMSDSEAVAVYNCFLDEYNALSDAEKLDYIRNCVSEDYHRYNADGATVDVEAFPETETAGEAVETERVSRTDLNLISKSTNVGDWGIVESYYDEIRDDYTITVLIAGYPENRLYDENSYFCQGFSLDAERFPKTIALIVKTCNAKSVNIRENILKAASDVDERMCDIDASYRSEGKNLSVLYVCLNGDDDQNARLNWQGGNRDRYSDDEKVVVRDIVVDSNEMIERLFNDTAATETVDFTKPFCRFIWNNDNSRQNGLPDRMVFYAQTENPVDYLHLLEQAESGQE